MPEKTREPGMFAAPNVRSLKPSGAACCWVAPFMTTKETYL